MRTRAVRNLLSLFQHQKKLLVSAVVGLLSVTMVGIAPVSAVDPIDEDFGLNRLSVNYGLCENGNNLVLAHNGAGQLPVEICFDSGRELVTIRNLAPYWVRINRPAETMWFVRLEDTSGVDVLDLPYQSVLKESRIAPGAIVTFGIDREAMHPFGFQVWPDDVMTDLGLFEIGLDGFRSTVLNVVPDEGSNLSAADLIELSVFAADYYRGNRNDAEALIILGKLGLKAFNNKLADAGLKLIEVVEDALGALDLADFNRAHDARQVFVARPRASEPPPAGELSVTFAENPFVCDGEPSRRVGTVSGALPNERITFSSPQMGGQFSTRDTNDAGSTPINWQCQPSAAGTNWVVTATGQTSGRHVTFTIQGVAPDAPPSPLTVAFTENPFVCDGVSRLAGTVSGAVPGEAVRFSSAQLGGELRTRIATSAGTSIFNWQCQPEDVGTNWVVTATGLSSGRSVSFTIESASAELVNGSFTGGVAGWKEIFLTDQVTLGSRNVGGDGHLSMIVTQSGASVGQDVGIAPQAGNTYTASIRAHSPSGEPVRVALEVWGLGGNNEVQKREVTIETQGNTDRRDVPITVQFTPTRNHNALRFEIRLLTPGATVLFDEAELFVEGEDPTGVNYLGYHSPTVTFLDGVDADQLEPGETYRVQVAVPTTTDQAWEQASASGPIRLGAIPNGSYSGSRSSDLFVDGDVVGSNWLSAGRIQLDQASTADGGTFTTLIKAPQELGAFSEEFRVVSENRTWLPGPTIEIAGTVVAATIGAPAAPTLGEVVTSTNSVTVNWEAAEGVNIRTTVSPGDFQCVVAADGQSCTASVLDPDTTYTIQVIAQADGLDSAPLEVTARTEPELESEPDPEPEPVVGSLLVRVLGSTGDERFEVRVDGVVTSFDATAEWAMYEVDVPVGTSPADVAVAFTNDAYERPYDRNLRVDYIELGGDRFETEAASTFSVGSWSPDNGCRAGYKSSEWLHCNGYFQYGDPQPNENTAPIAAIGTPSIEGRAVAMSAGGSSDPDGEVVSFEWEFGDGTTATGPEVRHDYAAEGSYTVVLTIVDDGGATASASVTVEIDAPEPEPEPEPEPVVGSLLVRVLGSTGDERFEVRVDGVVTSFDATAEWAMYEVDVPVGTSPADVAVAFTNDAYERPYDRNLRVDYIELGDDRFETEAASTFSVGSWSPDNGCRAGNKSSEWLHCNGYFQYGDPASLAVLLD